VGVDRRMVDSEGRPRQWCCPAIAEMPLTYRIT
jgi:hypothetical protein